MKKILLLLFCGISLFSLSAQNDTLFGRDNFEDEFLENIEDRLSDSETAEADYADNQDYLMELQIQKPNLNDMSPEIAATLLQMNDYQYYQLQLYIELYGDLVTIFELAAVEGFSREYAEKIAPYVEVKPSRNPRRLFRSFFRDSQQSLLLRYAQVIEKQAGYTSKADNAYLGNPMRLTFKYSFKSGEHFAMALAGEKDAGEEFFKGTQKQGFDHYAFFVNLKNIGILKNCVIGDYNLDFGQGLVFGSRNMGSKGGGAGRIRRFATLIRPAAPMNESTNMRGVAITLGNARHTGTLFYSHRFFDGNVFEVEDTDYFDGSLSVSGFHRTMDEVILKNKQRNRVYGAHFQIKRRIFNIGLTMAKTDFTAEILPAEELYKKFDFSGKSNCNAGIDYKVIIRKSVIFGEIGCSKNGGLAFLQGIVWDIDPRSKLAALFRYYDRRYLALNSSAFGESNLSHSETGLYLAADFVLGRKTELSLNGDLFYFPWLRFRVDKPASGFDVAAKLNVALCRNLQLNLRYQFDLKEENFLLSEYYSSTMPAQIHKFRCVLNYLPLAFFKMKTEIDYVVNIRNKSSPKDGILLFQDIGIEIQRPNLGINMRFAFFDTDTYDERIYAYEQDLLYMFTINGYYGKGMRLYLVLNYGYTFFDIQVRVGQTYYDDRTSIGSAQEMISGNRKTEAKAQIIFHL